jgi:ATP phosphoribosyltransferase regulatory subunit HisZ
MEANRDAAGFNNKQRSGLDARRADHDRTLEAMHRLEAALGEAAPGREEPWRNEVLEALSDLETATAEEADNARRPDSLLSDLSHNQPRLRNRARALRLQYAKVSDTIASLRQEIEEREDTEVDYADLRQRLGWVLTRLRHQRARESDLIYEAYYDAFKVDLRTAGEKGTP